MTNIMRNLAIASFLILLIMNSCKQRTTYEIYGIAEGVEDGLVVQLMNQQAKKEIAKTEVKGGKFHFEGSVDEPHLASLNFGHAYCPMVLENTEYKVLKGKYFIYADGGEINNKVFGYNLENELQSMRKVHGLAPDPYKGVDRMDKELVKKADKISRSRMKKEWDYETNYQRGILNGNHSMLVKLFTLCMISDRDYDWDKKLELLNEYEKELGAYPLLVQQRDMMLQAKKEELIRQSVSAGAPFKEVIGQSKDGKQLKLSEVIYKNKYTLLEMWASWCGPCRGEFPHLKKAYQSYHKKGFEIFALSLDTKENAWFKALDEENVPWINVVDYKGFESNSAKAYAVSGIPASFLIDQNGKIVATGYDVRGFSLDEKLEELFK